MERNEVLEIDALVQRSRVHVCYVLLKNSCWRHEKWESRVTCNGT